MSADVDAIFARATAGAREPTLRATDVYRYAKSPFAVWCEAHAPKIERDAPTGFQDLLFERGRAHEARVLARDHPGLAPLEFRTEKDGFRQALDAMAAGASVIAGAPLLWLPEGIGGRADVLVRNDSAPSAFGSYHYRVRKIKLARNLRRAHILQGAFYNHALGRIQERTPRTFTLVNMDGAEFPFDHDEEEILGVLAHIRRIAAGEPVEAMYDEGIWPWQSYTDQRAIETGDASLVTGVGPALRGSLAAAGFATVRALAVAREEELRAVHGVGPARAKGLPLAARAIAEGRHIRIGDVSLPDVPIEIFVDLEGTSEIMDKEDVEPMDYLIGALERRDGKEEFVSFIAHGYDKEEAMMREFLAWLAERPQSVLYHWAPYEATHFRKLCERYGLADAWRDLLQPRLRDLHRDATRAFAFPTYGAGLKKIAPYMGFRWQHGDVNAMESIALYLRYADDPAANGHLLQKIIDYNRDDCVATRVVKDWLVAEASTPRALASTTESHSF